MLRIDDELFYRRIEREDLVSRVKWVNDAEINQHLTFEVPISLASTEAWFNRTLLDSSKLNLTFFYNEEGEYKPVGFGGFINIDKINGKGELFITIGETRLHGKGFGKRLVNFLCELGFEELGLHKIYLTTLEQNERAQYLYTKCGFVKEGVLKEHIFHRGKRKNIVYMAKLVSS